MTLIVVSPHLDDAVLSVGAAIAARAAAGHDVVVVSVCSVVAAADRVAEDIAATAILGARCVHLGLADAPLRGIVENWQGLCGDTHDDAGFDAFVAAIADRLRPVLSSSSSDSSSLQVWGPLAVGDHVDHRATAAALASLGHFTAYEERPYARRRGAIAATWQRRGAAIVDDDDDDDGDDHVAFLQRIGAPAIAVLPTPAAVSFSDRRFVRERLPIDPASRRSRLQALQAYASQWPFVVGDVDAGGWPWNDDAEALWRPDV